MLHIGTAQEFIELTEIERYPPGSPCEGDVRVCVKVAFKAFGGEYDSVWLEKSALQTFIQELSILEDRRTGSARLESIGPKEFELTIRSRSGLGHMEVEASLSRFQYSGSTNWPTSVSGGFELEPDTLPSILFLFRKLAENLS